MWRIVIIEDDEKVRNGMKKIIPWEDLNCEWAGEAKNGQAGLDLIREVEPDIVITDIYMPIMNGIEMTQVLRDEGFEGKVIILSGYSEFEYARQAMRLRIEDYLDKPASIKTIREVLQKLVHDLNQETSERLQYTELREKIQVYEPLVQKEWIKSIVTGTANITSLPSSILSITEAWQDKEHIVIAVTFDQSLEKSLLYQSDWYLFRFALSNIIKETTQIIFKDFHFIELHSHQSVLCIHLKTNEYTDVQEELARLRERIANSLKKYLQVNVLVTIGGMKKDWNELSFSMKEALNQTKMENGLPYNIINDKNSGQKLFTTDLMEANYRLSEAVRYADGNSAINVINELFNQVKDQPFHKAYALQLGIEMWTIMTYSLYDIGIRIHDMFPSDFELYHELSNKNSWDHLSSFLKEKVQYICHHQQWDENLKHRQLVEQMINYVQENLSENITLQTIADELFISRNYLGQIFKKVVGEPYKNYITRVRMEKARKMIQEGNNLIYEISQNVGYENPAYFTTTFKKYMGYTPSDIINKRSLSKRGVQKSPN